MRGHSFCSAQNLTMLYIFKWLKKKKKKKEQYFVTHENIQIQVLINKVLLERSPAQWFSDCLGHFPATREKVSSYDRDLMAHRAKNIYYPSYDRESLLTPHIKLCNS